MVAEEDTREPVLGPRPWIDASARVVDCRAGRYTEIGPDCDLKDCILGDYSYLTAQCAAIHADIGRFANVAALVRLNPGQHPMDRASLHHFQYRSARYGLGPDDEAFFVWRGESRVRIGHDTWIGHGAVVMGGVSIGTGAVVGAGSVVTRDVADYSVVAGVPARPLRDRFPAEVQAALKRIAWWDWSHEQLRQSLADFRELDARAFSSKYDPATG